MLLSLSLSRFLFYFYFLFSKQTKTLLFDFTLVFCFFSQHFLSHNLSLNDFRPATTGVVCVLYFWFNFRLLSFSLSLPPHFLLFYSSSPFPFPPSLSLAILTNFQNIIRLHLSFLFFHFFLLNISFQNFFSSVTFACNSLFPVVLSLICIQFCFRFFENKQKKPNTQHTNKPHE